MEHVRAHAEALRLQSIEMDRVRAEKVTLEARKQSLERAMTRAAEDVSFSVAFVARVRLTLLPSSGPTRARSSGSSSMGERI